MFSNLRKKIDVEGDAPADAGSPDADKHRDAPDARVTEAAASSDASQESPKKGVFSAFREKLSVAGTKLIELAEVWPIER